MTGFSSPSSWCKLLVVALIVVAVLEVPAAKGAISPSQCKEEQRLLVNQCRAVISGSNASPACCQRVRVTHWECICPSVTPKLAALINVGHIVKQIEACGRSVPRKFKCGSITTP
ncbi:uncharacterized protein LOC119985643 [Tripterygium wilfordii]|uniref:uncharacterized protein LOC119985643 n=1 Tax=Tripterygium wilfordii TaxID=458696 RepID=UPI0018F820DA|nr:uncharacterized protein LOC119985643 [Tripterygium wilfordii]